MALERQQSIIPHHAAPVIGDLDELFAARFDLYPDACRTRVQRILQKFLDHRSRAFDYLSGGDLVGHGLGKNVDFAHGQKIPRCARDFGRGLALCSRPHNASTSAAAILLATASERMWTLPIVRRSLAALGISAAGSRYAHARITPQASQLRSAKAKQR